MDLKKFRFDYNLGQRELAEILGCHQTKVSLIEKGKRTITGSELGALIEKYGVDVIARYADPSELPAQSINIELSKTEIKGNKAPVQNGDGNQIVSDPALVDLLRQQIELNHQQSEHIKNLIDQQNRLIALLEKQSNSHE